MPEKLLPALLLAAIFLSSPAYAAELPKAPVAPGPVPCPSKGQGFVRLPGSDSCVRISGRVTAGMDLRAGHAPAARPLVAGRLAIDNRADTDLGEVRTYVRIGNGRR
ncbi:porin [Methylobacterium sp. E-065]|uniref:porin n=1 Tax=Methylobacterium sp. E-065 TaxID=2836583 RepID=UPI001FBA4C29|nr:porin [Methylobacterium sp. E-065]MCJ2021410.1 porin [Methylobacterium sp. E-065]